MRAFAEIHRLAGQQHPCTRRQRAEHHHQEGWICVWQHPHEHPSHLDLDTRRWADSRGATLGSATIGTNEGGALCRISRRQVNTC
ncbi:MAG: hypothetical protein DI601_08700 [Azospirillum brasilense]|nr:MAG: hypothetical protein DI601_08700 [Azospirillum brasilense]